MMGRWAARSIFVIAVVNFIAFVALSQKWGGDALNGRVVDGRFYLSDKGRLTEVSEARWRASRAHAISVIVTHVLAIGAGFALQKRNKGEHLA